MTQTNRLGFPVSQIMSQLADARRRFPEDSIIEVEDDPILKRSMTDEVTVSMQDLLNSPEFIEEQRLILLEFETARLRIEEDRRKTSSRRQELHRRSRRSSMGIKLTCPICLESLTSLRSSNVKMVTECGHIFCQECIESVCDAAKEKEALCPVCREDVGELRKVYF